MESIIKIVCDFYAYAILVAGVMGLLTRVGNTIIRAFSGKEDWL